MNMTTLKLYYDAYENSDGFFPSFDSEFSFKEIEICFIQEDDNWVQADEMNIPVISGFD
jgi:hypothetical protein